MPFNHNFADEDEENLIGVVRKSRGCFNFQCRDPAATKRCTMCHVAIYCSKECQEADWKYGKFPHKKVCKLYRNNIAPDTRPEGNGQKGPVAIGLLSVGLITEEICSKAMRDRADAFLAETKRCLDIDLKNDKYGFRKATIGLAAAVVCNLGKVRLQCAATVHDSEAEIGFGQGMMTVNHIIFEAVGEGGDEVQKRLHPASGEGDISEDCRDRVVEKLKAFFLRANNKYGISIQSVNFGRGLKWITDDDFRDAKKELEGANGGNMIIWMPDGTMWSG
mmetsp:Transcript_36753/g.66085  ORF Transcript_36753/g.66085 Transcript_36753/m.66085 type:complete len:277 (+) Transcript_36753:58-888(+)